jgi:hypothetical protein
MWSLNSGEPSAVLTGAVSLTKLKVALTAAVGARVSWLSVALVPAEA